MTDRTHPDSGRIVTSGAADLRTAAQAVVDRWDTPLWKDAPATAEYIGRLRAALASAPAQPVAEPADTVVLNAAMRAIQQAIELIGAPTDERMRAVRRVLRGAVIVAEDAGKVAPRAHALAYAALPEPLEIDWPELHSQALGCGVEDRDLHNRYECAEYGWQDGADKCAERVPEQIFDADQMHAFADATHALRVGQQGAAYADAHGAIMGAAYDFRDAHISGSPNQKRSAHAALESAATHALRASHGQAPAQAAPQPSPTPQADSVTAPSQQVIVDFAQVGTAGPFAVVDGRVSLPDATMQDLVHMLRPTFNAQAADSVLEDAARYRWLRDQAHPDSEDSGIAVSESDFNDWGNKFTRYYSGEELDAAIDAARKQGASHDR